MLILMLIIVSLSYELDLIMAWYDVIMMDFDVNVNVCIWDIMVMHKIYWNKNCVRFVMDDNNSI